MRAALLLLALVSAAPAMERERVDLSGTWEYARTSSLDQLPAEGWQPLAVPSTIPGYRYAAAWFRRTFEVPAGWAGRTLLLHFGGVRWNSRVVVNDQPVGGCFNGFDAFTLDISRAVRPGQVNSLRVGCHDLTGVFDPVQPPVVWENGVDVRDQPLDRVLAPIGGHVTSFGIWDTVELEAVAPVYASDVTVQTSVREKRLRVSATVQFGVGAAATVSGQVLDRASGQPVLALPAVEVATQQGVAPIADLAVDWPNPRLWSHEDPYLYDLQLTVTPAGDAAPSDQQTIRFGFRELRVRRDEFLLNGWPLQFLASSWWPPQPPASDDQVRAQLLALKRANTHMFRTHTQPWPRNWYRLADELGILMIPEAAVWNDDGVYRLDDPRFWDHYREHLQAMVRQLKNHPSVVLWSLENEFAGNRLSDATPERESNLAALSEVVRTADPTRPVTYESDLDPGFKADVIGLHYPNEWPAQHLWPNCADWLDKPIPTSGGGGGFWDGQPFLWTRQKPLYIGEFLWIPSNNPDWSTIFLGDAAYADYHRSRATAKALSWEMQIQAYRRAGVSGMSPWTTIEHGALDESNPTWLAHQRAYRPIAVFGREWDRRFFAGETVTRQFDLVTNVLRETQPTVVISFSGGGSARWTARPLLGAGRQAGQVSLTAPRKAGPSILRLAVEERGQVVFEDRFAVTIAARPALQPPRDIGLYDPQGTAAMLKLPAVRDLTAPLPRLLVVAPDALLAAGTTPAVPQIGGAPGPGARLAGHVRAGGRLLVLSQTRLPQDLFGLSVVNRDSTMAFATQPSHPLLQGLTAADLQFWRGDHLVTRHEIVRPARGQTLPLIVTGSQAGVNTCALLEVRQGQGTALFCTLRLTDKLTAEPVAGRLLQAAWRYLDGYRAAPQRTGLWCADTARRAVLETVGLEARSIPAAPAAPGDLDGLDTLVLVDPPSLVPWTPALQPFLQRGGKVLLAQLAAARGPELAALGMSGVTLSTAAAAVVKREGVGGPFAEQLLREDLYWLGPPPSGFSWSDRSRAAGQTVAVAQPQVDPSAGTVYSCAAMLAEGAVVRQTPESTLLASSGTVRGTVRVPRAGDWVIGVTGSGSPVDQTWPLVAVSVNGRRLGEVYLGSAETATYGLRATLAAGEQALELRFTNDASNAHEDRNATLVQVNLAPAAPAAAGLVELTSPAAVLLRPVGKGLLVVESLRWDQAIGNESKARRYLASLLTAVGASCRAGQGGWAVEAETMALQPGLQWSRPTGDHMAMVQACWCETPVDVAQAGRYRLTLVARGAPAAEDWPVARLLLDGQPLGELKVDSASWCDRTLIVELPAGRHTLRIDYQNDLWDQVRGQDRNLYVDKLLFEPAA
ncbi:MAG: hypothetical protein IT204_13715 [Fimbriimonadaceae bacterium]|nr:hypothetical protein [Fimbriimonadaceae bacterium]